MPAAVSLWSLRFKGGLYLRPPAGYLLGGGCVGQGARSSNIPLSLVEVFPA